MNKINLETKYIIPEEVAIREMEGEYLLINSMINELFTLNPLGYFIWQKIVDNNSFGEIIDLVSIEYDILNDQVISDICVFIDELEVNEFVRRVGN